VIPSSPPCPDFIKQAIFNLFEEIFFKLKNYINQKKQFSKRKLEIVTSKVKNMG
jgi:hypothetical protein